MKDEIKEILEKPNVYSFNDECYLYFGDYNKLKDYITNLQEENEKLNNVIETLKETNKLLINQKYKLEYELDKLDNLRDKAIEYIDNHTLFVSGGIVKSILQGSEEK